LVNILLNNLIIIYTKFDVLETFISANVSQLEERFICENCQIKFNEIDEHQSRIEKIKSELVMLYQSSETLEIKPNIKVESLDDTFEELQIFEQTSPTPKRSSRNSKKIKSEEREKKRANQSDGFTVTDIDGKLYYKCNICSKVVVRRPQLHRLTHTNTERKFKCDECNLFFKSLKCLYGHRKTHGERTYFSW
jgi:hypothetical protein